MANDIEDDQNRLQFEHQHQGDGVCLELRMTDLIAD